jgi:hypothetical protein
MRPFSDIDLPIGLRCGLRSAVIAVVAGLLFGAYMVAADALVFHAVIPGSQAELLLVPAAQRIVYFARGALIDELEFRLVLMTALVWLFVTLAGSQRQWCYWASILLAALVAYPLAHWAYLAALQPGALAIAREVSLHGAAGALWGYLYWRHGFVAAVLGHVSAHLTLEPLLGLG